MKNKQEAICPGCDNAHWLIYCLVKGKSLDEMSQNNIDYIVEQQEIYEKRMHEKGSHASYSQRDEVRTE